MSLEPLELDRHMMRACMVVVNSEETTAHLAAVGTRKRPPGLEMLGPRKSELHTQNKRQVASRHMRDSTSLASCAADLAETNCLGMDTPQ